MSARGSEDAPSRCQHYVELNTLGDFMTRSVAVITLSLAMMSSLPAQQPSASVVGRVTDASGAVIPGVAIRIVNLDTNIAQNGASNQAGDFTIPYLAPGRYSLEATLQGFRS